MMSRTAAAETAIPTIAPEDNFEGVTFVEDELFVEDEVVEEDRVVAGG